MKKGQWGRYCVVVSHLKRKMAAQLINWKCFNASAELSCKRRDEAGRWNWEKRQSKTLINHEERQRRGERGWSRGRVLGNLARKVNLIDGNFSGSSSTRRSVAGQNNHHQKKQQQQQRLQQRSQGFPFEPQAQLHVCVRPTTTRTGNNNKRYISRGRRLKGRT